MKIIFINLNLVILLVLLTNMRTFGQWDETGNLAPPGSVLGTTNSEPLPFITDGSERMRITTAGDVGINTATPDMRLHVEGGILATDTIGANPNLGAGIRMMWIPNSYSFRGGVATNSEWDSPNVGNASFAFGSNVQASGNGATTFGSNNDVAGNNSFASGQNLTVSGTESFSLGTGNTVNGSVSAALGAGNLIATGADLSYAMGKDIELSNTLEIGIGCFLNGTADGNITIGSGINAITPFNNAINNCLMVGFNSDLPTFFVEEANGAGTTGRVGIGTTTLNAKTTIRNVETTPVVNRVLQIEGEGGAFLTGSETTLTGDANSLGVNGAVINSNGNATTTAANFGVAIEANTAAGIAVGTQSIAQNAPEARGVFGSANLASNAYGVWGQSSANDTLGNSAGVVALCLNNVPLASQTHFGLYAEGDNGEAAYFAGNTVTGGVSWALSDQEFKSNITDIESPLDIISQLQPKAYEFNTTAYPHMHLPPGQRYGFLAQEVQETLPSLVKSYSKLELTDPETGEVISEGQDHLAVSYTELIPLLVGATQEQQATIEQLQSDLAVLQAQVAACCEAKSANGQGMGQSDFNLEVIPTPSDLKQNYPNPFAQQTTIQYTIGCACKAEIVVYDQSGRLIASLVSGSAEPGTYSVNWDASNLESGIYFYTLIVDGQEFVKRAVKI